uniref:Putative ovule protein n=1 Tax=Solanum chacoense TaxID=4108 RepID=A0A0V0GM47_SOLCH
MRHQRNWDFLKGWLPLSAMPVISPLMDHKNQQPFEINKKKQKTFIPNTPLHSSCSSSFSSLCAANVVKGL